MATPVTYIPKITEAGKAAAINAGNLGIQITITHIGLGTGQYNPTGNEQALFNEVKRVPATGVMRPAPNQMRIAGAWAEYGGESEIGEIGIFVGNVLFAVWSRASGGPVGYKTAGVDFVVFFDLKFDEIPIDSVNIVINPDVNEALSALVIHEVADDAHIQYLRRSDFASAHDLIYAYAVSGTGNSILIELPIETNLVEYKPGVQVVFMAAQSNTGPVTVNVSDLGSASIRKAGAAPLEANDIRAGVVYTIVFDGTNFQISGGLGTAATLDAYTKAESDSRYMPIGTGVDLSPAGEVGYFATTSAPTGWLKANGAAVSRTTYAKLFAAIGTTYGAGDGSTTFRLPDLRGEFIRGLDDGRGLDPFRVLGSQQAGMVQKHKHAHIGEKVTSQGAGPFGHTTGANFRGNKGGLDGDNNYFYTNDGSNIDNEMNPAGLMGDETRPRNIALLACIRY